VRSALVAFMSVRLDAAVRAGCDGVDMDNVDAYDNVKPRGRITVGGGQRGLGVTGPDGACTLRSVPAASRCLTGLLLIQLPPASKSSNTQL
jgi:hypothetical protein